MTLHPQYVLDENRQETAIIIPKAEWEMILAELEELDDIRAYDEAKAVSQEAIPFERAVREIEEGKIR